MEEIPRPHSFHRFLTEGWYCSMQTCTILLTMWKWRALWCVCVCVCVCVCAHVQSRQHRRKRDIYASLFGVSVCSSMHPRITDRPALMWQQALTLVPLDLCNPDNVALLTQQNQQQYEKQQSLSVNTVILPSFGLCPWWGRTAQMF